MVAKLFYKKEENHFRLTYHKNHWYTNFLLSKHDSFAKVNVKRKKYQKDEAERDVKEKPRSLNKKF
jgi:hypothetical protein